MKKIVILISGRGSNMEALLRAELPCQIAAVISNKADAVGLQTAQAHGIATRVLPHQGYADREQYDQALARLIDELAPDYIVLAGFMRILSAEFVNHFHHRILNIHPSLLPSHTGLHTHKRALEDGVRIHGCTVHFVTAELDHGPIIIQAAVPVMDEDSEQTLAQRVLREEHRIYPQALRWLCNGQIELHENGVVRFKQARQPSFSLISPGLE